MARLRVLLTMGLRGSAANQDALQACLSAEESCRDQSGCFASCFFFFDGPLVICGASGVEQQNFSSSKYALARCASNWSHGCLLRTWLVIRSVSLDIDDFLP
jgi:hypothetical protein